MGLSFYHNQLSGSAGPGRGLVRAVFREPQRFLLGPLLLMVWLLWGSGCSKGEGPATAALSEPVLRVGTAMTVKQANPVADYYYNKLAMVMTHDSLVRFDEDLNAVPQLAVKFGSDGEGRIWTFDLNPHARWHDGRPVTPEDVKFTFEYLAKNHVSGGWAGHIIDRIETRENQVVFRLKKPYSRFLINAGFAVRILPRHIWEGISDPYETSDKAVAMGCGPYRLDCFDRSAGTVSFRVNHDYYGPVPKTERVDFRTYGTTDLLALALIKGQVDLQYQYAAGMPVPYVNKLAAQPHLACMAVASMGIPAVLGFNLSRPLVRALAVRRAVALAMDYSQINACLMQGEGKIPSPGMVPPPFPFQADAAPWKQDLDQSRTLLASEGWMDRDGDGILETAPKVPAVLTLLVRSDLWGENQLVKLLARDLRKIGLGLKVRSADLSTYLAFLKEGAYDLVLFRTTPWGMMMHAGYGTGYFDARTTGSLNMCRLKDDAFFRLCDGILENTDPNRLKTLYAEVRNYYAKHLPAVALCWGRSFFPYNKTWRGFRINQLEGGLANRFSWRDLAPPGPERAEVR